MIKVNGMRSLELHSLLPITCEAIHSRLPGKAGVRSQAMVWKGLNAGLLKNMLSPHTLRTHCLGSCTPTQRPEGGHQMGILLCHHLLRPPITPYDPNFTVPHSICPWQNQFKTPTFQDFKVSWRKKKSLFLPVQELVEFSSKYHLWKSHCIIEMTVFFLWWQNVACSCRS